MANFSTYIYNRPFIISLQLSGLLLSRGGREGWGEGGEKNPFTWFRHLPDSSFDKFVERMLGPFEQVVESAEKSRNLVE